MNEQEQIAKLAEMISNSKFMGDSNLQIAEMALTMALHWNKDTKESAPQMYAMLESFIEFTATDENLSHEGFELILLGKGLLAKAQGES